ncbi:GIDE domain-containing protein [Streptomyces sp. NPDC048172]|uniref:GIDE domain-containing protein n=1 Tax=Streptomyces sp. NPDC048172 TaxID=3365505 RepID=UPI00371A7772
MLWIGLFALVVAVGCAYLARAAHLRARAMESTEAVSAAELRALRTAAVEAGSAGYFRYRCELTGQAAPHKNGALRSELEGLECVWHRHRITRKYEETYRDGKGNRRRRTRTETMSEHSSPTAFFVQDATGRTVVRPGGAEVVGAEKVLDRFDPHQGGGGGRLRIGPVSLDLGRREGTIGFQREEWIVRPGSRFYVHGEAADADGRLAVTAPAEGGVFVMSVKSEAELLRGENTRVAGFGVAAGLAAVGGCVALVLALVG